jgi:hypothetical protein
MACRLQQAPTLAEAANEVLIGGSDPQGRWFVVTIVAEPTETIGAAPLSCLCFYGSFSP